MGKREIMSGIRRKTECSGMYDTLKCADRNFSKNSIKRVPNSVVTDHCKHTRFTYVINKSIKSVLTAP